MSKPGLKMLEEWSEAAAKNAEDAVASIEAAVNSAESDLCGHVAASEGISSMVNTFVSALATDIPTGATPMKRAYNFPSPFGKMTPRAEVLRKCREEESTDVPNESRTEMEDTRSMIITNWTRQKTLLAQNKTTAATRKVQRA